jgi:metal-responsive CopG/Arc/MetJ family transcriptional regulator
MAMATLFGVSMSRTLRARLDDYCREAHMTRSRIIRRAILFYLRTHKPQDEVEEEA